MRWVYILLLIGAFHAVAYAADWQPPVVVNILVGVAAYYIGGVFARSRIGHWFGRHQYGEWTKPTVWNLIHIGLDGCRYERQGLVQERVCRICGGRTNRVVRYLDRSTYR